MGNKDINEIVESIVDRKVEKQRSLEILLRQETQNIQTSISERFKLYGVLVTAILFLLGFLGYHLIKETVVTQVENKLIEPEVNKTVSKSIEKESRRFIEEKISPLNKEVFNIKSGVDTIERRFNKTEENMEGINNKIDSALNKIGSINKEVEKDKQKVEKINKDYDVFLTKLNASKSEIENIEKNITELKRQIKNAQTVIKTLESGIDLMNYQDVSLYSPTGNKAGKIGTFDIISTPINDWSKKYVHYEDDGSGGSAVFKCIPGAKDACLEVINKMPLYPFSYYFLAQCLKEEGDLSWVEMAQKAKDILEKTTRIQGHKSQHDKILKRVNIMLEDTANN